MSPSLSSTQRTGVDRRVRSRQRGGPHAYGRLQRSRSRAARCATRRGGGRRPWDHRPTGRERDAFVAFRRGHRSSFGGRSQASSRRRFAVARTRERVHGNRDELRSRSSSPPSWQPGRDEVGEVAARVGGVRRKLLAHHRPGACPPTGRGRRRAARRSGTVAVGEPLVRDAPQVPRLVREDGDRPRRSPGTTARGA